MAGELHQPLGVPSDHEFYLVGGERSRRTTENGELGVVNGELGVVNGELGRSINFDS